VGPDRGLGELLAAELARKGSSGEVRCGWWAEQERVGGRGTFHTLHDSSGHRRSLSRPPPLGAALPDFSAIGIARAHIRPRALLEGSDATSALRFSALSRMCAGHTPHVTRSSDFSVDFQCSLT